MPRMNTPVIDLLIRLGWAFLCGFCIFMVPLLIRRACHGETTAGRITAAIFSLLFLAAFVFLALYLWQNYVPQSDAPSPPPAAALPPPSAVPFSPAAP